MNNLTTIILIYLLIINVVTFIVYGIDKYKAKHAKWRISEATLLLLAAIGGSIGAWCGMKVWHHKTMHKKFKYGVPAIFILQVALAVWIIKKWRKHRCRYNDETRQTDKTAYGSRHLLCLGGRQLRLCP